MAALHPDLDAVASLDAYTGELSTVQTVDAEEDALGELVYSIVQIAQMALCVGKLMSVS